MKSNRSSCLEFVKEDSRKDDIKSFDQLTFFDKLSAECDSRANKLITSTSVDEISHFPFELKYAHAASTGNQIVLNRVTKETARN